MEYRCRIFYALKSTYVIWDVTRLFAMSRGVSWVNGNCWPMWRTHRSEQTVQLILDVRPMCWPKSLTWIICWYDVYRTEGGGGGLVCRLWFYYSCIFTLDLLAKSVWTAGVNLELVPGTWNFQGRVSESVISDLSFPPHPKQKCDIIKISRGSWL